MKKVLKAVGVLGGSLLLVVSAPGSAWAQSWTTYDTDSLNRSVPSQKVYTTSASMKWMDEDLNYPTFEVADSRAQWTAKLKLNGAKGSCARLRIITYKSNGIKFKVSKRFPADASKNFGYYRYCQSDGKGSKTYGGADNLDVGYGTVYNNITKANVKICYSRKKSIAPGSDCYSFTVRYGD